MRKLQKHPEKVRKLLPNLLAIRREEDDRDRHAARAGGGELTFTDARIPHTTGPY